MADPLKPLQAIAAQNPAQNSRIAQGLQAARATGLQSQIAAAPQGISNPRAAQQVGAQQAAQAGTIRTQTAATTAQQQAELGKMGLDVGGKQQQLKMQKAQLTMKARANELANKLYQLDKTLKNKLLDESIAFEKDDMSRTLFNERQLLDYKIASTKSDIALRKYEQEVSQMSQRRIQMLQTALNKVKQAEEQAMLKGQQGAAQGQMKTLAQAKINLEKKLRDEAARKKNRASQFAAGGAIIGGVIGAIYGGPAGAAAGASIGGGAGTAVAGATEEEA